MSKWGERWVQRQERDAAEREIRMAGGRPDPGKCYRCGAPFAEHDHGRCPRPPIDRSTPPGARDAGGNDLHTEGNLPGAPPPPGTYQPARRPGGHAGLTATLAVVGVVAGVVWLLTATAAANCSTLAQLGGSTCYPSAAELHTLGGWVALIALAGAVLAAVMGRK